MNVIKLYGGLGNQMFQYALGVHMSNVYKTDVIFDKSWFKREQDPPRPYRLDKFFTHVRAGLFLAQKTIHEDRSHYYKYNEAILTMKEANIFGYWQHHKYIEPILPILKEEFCLKQTEYTSTFTELRAMIICNESTALHVRRGDYVSINGHHLLPLDYYKEALTYTKGKVYIFSDDLFWCKENFTNAIFVDESDYHSIELMKLCKHKIIANSTFSWWAAMLSKSTGVVVAPKKWREDPEEQRRIDEEGMCPEHWIRL